MSKDYLPTAARTHVPEALKASGPLLERLPETPAIPGFPEGWLEKPFMQERSKGASPPHTKRVPVDLAPAPIADRAARGHPAGREAACAV